MAVRLRRDINASMRKAWGGSWCRYAQALMKRFFFQHGNYSGQQIYMKPAYQATRDGAEAKEARKKKYSLNGSMLAPLFHFIRCYIKCLCLISIPKPSLPLLGLHTAPSTSPTPSRGRWADPPAEGSGPSWGCWTLNCHCCCASDHLKHARKREREKEREMENGRAEGNGEKRAKEWVILTEIVRKKLRAKSSCWWGENDGRAERCMNGGRERKRNRQRVSWDNLYTAASLKRGGRGGHSDIKGLSS